LTRRIKDVILFPYNAGVVSAFALKVSRLWQSFGGFRHVLFKVGHRLNNGSAAAFFNEWAEGRLRIIPGRYLLKADSLMYSYRSGQVKI